MAWSITAVIFIWPFAARVTSSGIRLTPLQIPRAMSWREPSRINAFLPVRLLRGNMGRHPYPAGDFHQAVQGRPVNAGVPVDTASMPVGVRAEYQPYSAAVEAYCPSTRPVHQARQVQVEGGRDGDGVVWKIRGVQQPVSA